MLGIVNILNREYESCGTGVFVSPKGYILTCKHVLMKDAIKEDTIFYKYEEDSKIYKASCLDIAENEDIVVLQAEERKTTYLPLFIYNDFIREVEVYGFPRKSQIILKTNVSIDRVDGIKQRIQLGKANAITHGFSGAPLVYDGTVIGIVNCIPTTDEFGRLLEIAFAISSKRIKDIFPQYICERQICIGYGIKKNKCLNLAFSKKNLYCKECFKEEFIDTIKALYIAQNYQVYDYKNYFVCELQYGLLKYFNSVFCLVKFDEMVTLQDMYMIENSLKDCIYNISHIIIVTNADLDGNSIEFAEENKIEVLTREKLLRTLFDFNIYKNDLVKYVESEQLATHYIEIYGTSKIHPISILNDHTHHEEEIDSIRENEETYISEVNNMGNKEAGTQPAVLLKNYVDDFLISSHKALLILGDYGSGKTSFCYTYTLKLLDKFIEMKSNILPILVKLRGYNKAVGIAQLLTDYFVNELGINNFNMSSLKLLLKNMNVVMIFDGYDEVAKKVDFDVKYDVLKEICSFIEDNTKIIITCRPNYFQSSSEYERIFKNSHYSYEPGEKKVPDFIENSIADLNEKQIKCYIDSYQRELRDLNVSIPDILKAISDTHDLTDLAKRPFLLYMILKTLPEILKEEGRIYYKKINAAKLYLKYTDVWINREDRKNKTLIRKEDKELFCKEIAFKLYVSDSKGISYKEFPETIKKHFRNLERIEDIDYFTHDIQSCSFLTSDRTGYFTFIHKSFMEYFVADRVVCKIDESMEKSRKNNSDIIINLNDIIGKVYFSMEICFFIVDILELSKKNILNEVIYYYSQINSIAKSNLLSIMAKRDNNMVEIFRRYKITSDEIVHVDFSNSKFIGGIIKNISFENIQFFSTNFNGVKFENCDFNGSVFNKGEMENVQFFNCKFASSQWKQMKIRGCSFYNSDIVFLDDYNEDFKLKDFGIKEEIEYDKLHKENIQSGSKTCNFEKSIWEETLIIHCLFYECNLVDTIMNRMNIAQTIFAYVDFSSIKIGYGSYTNNRLIEVLGGPYQLS